MYLKCNIVLPLFRLNLNGKALISLNNYEKRLNYYPKDFQFLNLFLGIQRENHLYYCFPFI